MDSKTTQRPQRQQYQELIVALPSKRQSAHLEALLTWLMVRATTNKQEIKVLQGVVIDL